MNSHADARAQLEKTKALIADRTKREEEMKRLAGAAEAYNAGLKHYQSENWDQALEEFSKVQELEPAYEEVVRYVDSAKKALSEELFNEARVDTDNGRLEEALEKLSRAHELNPGNASIKTSLDVVKRDFKSKNERESLKLYQEGLEAFIDGRTSAAEKLWKQSINLNPQNEDAIRSLEKLEAQKTSVSFDE